MPLPALPGMPAAHRVLPSHRGQSYHLNAVPPRGERAHAVSQATHGSPHGASPCFCFRSRPAAPHGFPVTAGYRRERERPGRAEAAGRSGGAGGTCGRFVSGDWFPGRDRALGDPDTGAQLWANTSRRGGVGREPAVGGTGSRGRGRGWRPVSRRAAAGTGMWVVPGAEDRARAVGGNQTRR